MTRVGTCQREGCEERFVDTSPSQNRRFCSANCCKRHNEATTGRGSCVDCGDRLAPRSKGRNDRCVECENARRHASQAERWSQIEKWWAEGISGREIAARLGWGPNSQLSSELDRMRRGGRHVPRRYKPYRKQAA